MPEVKEKKKRITNAQLQKEIAAYEDVVTAMSAETAELSSQVAALQEALVRVVSQWDLQMQQVGGAVQEVIVRMNALTAGIDGEPTED
mgnify:FL=1|tara:strand:+ start:328 stop:591 length:264 start_codon:yes stop_codon:yes gene_type:complete